MIMKKHALFLLLLPLFNSCGTNNAAKEQTLTEAKKGFITKLTRIQKQNTPPEQPPAGIMNLITYPSTIGNMAAYLSVIPDDHKLHPAIVWVSGGFGNDIGDVWTPQDSTNDQSASAYWRSGIITMYPSQRGAHGNPGSDETCLGEVDDIIAAAKFLAKQPGVDPKRIYLGGHSTGGTKALLAAECTDMFRAVFCFGAVAAATDYGDDIITFNGADKKEAELRSPIKWLANIKTPTFVIEGETGNIQSLFQMKARAKELQLDEIIFMPAKGHSHFSILHLINKGLAKKIVSDNDSISADTPFGF
jgi:dipeptidyl aminopeptidase/acylaminoacyl peptidase